MLVEFGPRRLNVIGPPAPEAIPDSGAGCVPMAEQFALLQFVVFALVIELDHFLRV